jgi:hypothetical protein
MSTMTKAPRVSDPVGPDTDASASLGGVTTLHDVAAASLCACPPSSSPGV